MQIYANKKNLDDCWSSFGIVLLLLFLVVPVTAQEDHFKDVYQPTTIRQSLQGTRNYSGTTSKSNNQEQGHAQYERFNQHDGNLVTGPAINSGLLSFSGTSNAQRFGWPKGSQWVSYIWGSYFFVAAEVVDANNDTIHIVSDHFRFGEQSPDGSHTYATMPLPRYYNLDQPNAQSTPLIKGISEDVGIDGIPNSGDTGEGDGILQPAEDFNGNGELDLSMQNVVGWLATSHRRETWPTYWPAGSYPGDDRSPGENRAGVRAGRWNGEFGALIRADQESYYVMDDRENDEFLYYPFNDTLSWPNGRRGLGLTTEVRGYQWNARLAEDIYISIYDISNEGKDLEKCVVGMNVDPDLGDNFTNDDAFFDQIDDITYAWNKLFIASNGLPLGYFGFAFLESPGLALDGIDNDQDGLIDESQNNGIDDDGDWTPWEDRDGDGLVTNEDLNFNGELDPGEDVNGNAILDIDPLNDDVGADGLGPEDSGYTGADIGEANGQPDLGEPNFEFTDNDESDQVGLTSWFLKDTDGQQADDERFWSSEIQPGTFQIRDGYQRDITFTYGSGFIKFADSERNHRYAIALLFGNDFDDILRNKRTMQQIYDNDYNFTKPPRQPILESTTADDGRIFLEWDTGAERSRDPIYGFDFEAYYIYRSTEPAFVEIKTITDGFGNPLLFKPRAIFDIENGLTGLHPIRIGSELGPGSDLGVTYNMGNDTGLEHRYVDEDVTNGRTYYYAIASLDQGYDPSFYPDISAKESFSPISPTECAFNIQVDPLGRPISFDRNTAALIPTEHSGGWVAPSLSEEGISHVSGLGTGTIQVEIYDPLQIATGHQYKVQFFDDQRYARYDSLYYSGLTNKMEVTNLTTGELINVIVDPENDNYEESYINEGFRVVVKNDTNLLDAQRSTWTTGSAPLTVKAQNSGASGIAVARDYEIRVMQAGADTSFNRRPANFQVFDVTDDGNPEFKLDFVFLDRNTPGILDDDDIVNVINLDGGLNRFWFFEFDYDAAVDSSLHVPPVAGDIMRIFTRKTFDSRDAFEFTLIGNIVTDSQSKVELDNIYTVPDPYIAVSSLERKVLNAAEGRGDRRIDFVNLPPQCTVHIFTAAGKLVRTMEHSASAANRRMSWDLRTKDGLEISHGVYFYVVEVPGVGTKRGKFAVIK